MLLEPQGIVPDRGLSHIRAEVEVRLPEAGVEILCEPRGRCGENQ
ncbi:MAG TPA: hypothetical protein VFB37_02000 [Steroidobacteraceae bacterium]|nr:hypothetical protein [Steroidobacteraceae bacterium]